MRGLVGNRIADLRAIGARDRRNDAYRREHWVDRVILACFVLRLSTRKVGEVLLPTVSERVSPATVSWVARTLDAAVEAFRRRPLANRYQALVFDGVVLTRKTGMGAQRRPVLVALGRLWACPFL
jgi:putative transposase